MHFNLSNNFLVIKKNYKKKNSSWFIISFWDSWNSSLSFCRKTCAQAICTPFLVLFFYFYFIYLFLDEWGNFINRKIITWSSKERKTEIYTSAEKTANPCSKKTSYQAKLKQTQTKITKQHPILYWHFKTCSSSITLTSI